MKTSDPKVYPIIASFEEQLKLMGIDIEIDEAIGPGATHEKIALITAASVMHETLGEYEHGTAEPQELVDISVSRKKSLEIIRNVYIDLLLTMGAK